MTMGEHDNDRSALIRNAGLALVELARLVEENRRLVNDLAKLRAELADRTTELVNARRPDLDRPKRRRAR